MKYLVEVALSLPTLYHVMYAWVASGVLHLEIFRSSPAAQIIVHRTSLFFLLAWGTNRLSHNLREHSSHNTECHPTQEARWRHFAAVQRDAARPLSLVAKRTCPVEGMTASPKGRIGFHHLPFPWRAHCALESAVSRWKTAVPNSHMIAIKCSGL